jgi:hypothetical protein
MDFKTVNESQACGLGTDSRAQSAKYSVFISS